MSSNQTQSISYLIIAVGVLFTILFILCGIYFYIDRVKNKSKRQDSDIKEKHSSNKSKVQQMYNVQSIFNFMEFDKIEDNMIVQKNGKRFLMVVNCQGINFDLMSVAEKNSVEQGFLQYLNTLREPIQLYIQTRTVNLSNSLNTYAEKVNVLKDNLNQKEFEYNRRVRSGKYDSRQLDAQKYEVIKARNLYEYGTDIVNNTQRMSLNKNILTKKYYIVISHFPEEANNSIYSKEEVSAIAFSELYTRAQSTIGFLSVCGVAGKILDSNELAELLYTAYNRDEAEIYDLNKAINSGYDSLYSTSQDVLEKKMEELDKQIELDAIDRANSAINTAIQERDIEIKLREKQKEYEEIVNAMAGLIVEDKKNYLGDEITEKAKKIITETKTTKRKSGTKEVKVDDQEEKGKRTRRTKKSA